MNTNEPETGLPSLPPASCDLSCIQATVWLAQAHRPADRCRIRRCAARHTTRHSTRGRIRAGKFTVKALPRPHQLAPQLPNPQSPIPNPNF